MKKFLFALAMACLVLVAGASVTGAQGNELELLLTKNMGLALGDQIQGSFTLSVSGPEDMTSVTYMIDGNEMATVTQAPLRYSFSTDSYAPGRHTFSATAKTTSGQTLKSNVIDVEIVTLAAGLQAGTRVLIPIFGVVLVIIVVMVAIQVLPIGRNKRRFEPGAVRNYGAAGGTICPNCGRPFARSIFALHLGNRRLERCPYCGKWSMTRPASIEALRAAEQAELQGAKPAVHELTPEELLRQQIEESRLSR
jgi:hypothetical protein